MSELPLNRRPSSLLTLFGVSAALSLLLAGVPIVEAMWFPLILPAKGSVAPHTIRARNDVVFDLHETYVAEAAEAKQKYVPIYNKDNELVYEYKKTILAAALAEKPGHWKWPATSARGAGRPDGAPRDAGPRDVGAADGEAGAGDASDSGVEDAGADIGRRATPQLIAARKKELEALIRGCFRLLIPYYKRGVVSNSEFPKQKKNIRISSRGRFVVRPVAELHRFSTLWTDLERSAAQFFFKTDPRVRLQVIDYILQRLPPNLTYASANDKFIKDISQVTGVKVVQIRRGDVLVRRGGLVDTRAFYAIQASIKDRGSRSSLGLHGVRFGLLLVLLTLMVVTARDTCPAVFRTGKSFLPIFAGLVIMVLLGEVVMLYLPLHLVVVPQAAIALVMAVVLGRVPGMFAAVTVPCALILVHFFDLSTLIVGVAGGVTATMVVRRRRRSSALVAGVLVGVIQALAFEACRALEGRPRTYDEMWSAAAAFGGGLLAGAGALIALPFVEWLLGRSSRGKLKVLTDFDHPLVRELRERAPGTFAHTVTLINMVELATDAVGGDRLLARAGTLFHDLGKMESPQFFIENQGQGPNVHDELTSRESARAILAHIPAGLKIARRHHLPKDVVAFIPEHHGTTTLEFFLSQARDSGEDPDPELFRYGGPKPQSVETAILMIADSVEAASKTLAKPTTEALEQLVDKIVFRKFSELQFDACGISQAELQKIKSAFVTYLEGALHRRVAYPSSAP